MMARDRTRERLPSDAIADVRSSIRIVLRQGYKARSTPVTCVLPS